MGVDFESRLGVQPTHRAAETDPLGGDYADVGGGKGLAQGAGIEGIHFFVLQFFKAVIPLLIVFTGQIPHFQNLLLVSVDGNLYTVHDGRELGLELGVQNFSDVLQAESLGEGVV